ncbi:hypothetical protein FHS83_001047 [Rhizomicrobium palustre]|uniref:DUF3857 domain-containing protein n=1 Tax=Rhizomicrobium palustre TaxID=189966 RepID=A0A846MWW3_9PROT|nr:DUF3857 domain-containing transglutaminase family protein [Rhizomicrobium palustre]NIK87729.1 hypothetical protein [Rhizomicrobium palustre]
MTRVPFVLFTAGVLLSPAFAEEATPAITWQKVERTISLNHDGTALWRESYEVTANNEAGVEGASRIAEPYDALRENVKIIEAYTKKADGEIVAVAPGAIFDMSPQDDGVFITSIRQKLILFPNFESGDTAHFVLEKTVTQPEFPGHVMISQVTDPGTSVALLSEEVRAPKSLNLHLDTRGMAFTTEDKGDARIYRWRYQNAKPEAQDDVWISPQAHFPSYALSSFANYGELGNAYAGAMAPKLELTPALVELANKVAPATLSRREQAEKLYDWVATHIRYVGLELGRGGWVPHEAAAILANGYGDCKDHDTLLQVLLKAKGIKAQSALINAGAEYALPPVPSFHALNHVITYLPEFKLYVDSTSQVAPFGVLAYSEYGKPVVIATPSASGTAHTPVLATGASSLQAVTEQTLAPDGTLRGTTRIETAGPSSLWLRGRALSILQAGPTQAAQNELANLGYQHASGRFEISPPLARSRTYALTGHFTADGWSEKLKGLQSFRMPRGFNMADPPGDGSMGPLLPLSLKDDAEVQCTAMHNAEDITLRLPAGYRVKDIPADTKIETAHIRYTATWRREDDALHLVRVFDSKVDVPVCSGALRAEAVGALKAIAHEQQTRLWLVPAKPQDLPKTREQKPSEPRISESKPLPSTPSLGVGVAALNQ